MNAENGFFTEEQVNQYLQHSSQCQTLQNWEEALQAMADTPNEFRDEGWYIAQNEIEKKRTTCNCYYHSIKLYLTMGKPKEIQIPQLGDENLLIYPFEDLPEIDKDLLVKEFLQICANHSLQLFRSLGLQDFIGGEFVDPETNERFSLKWQKLPDEKKAE